MQVVHFKFDHQAYLIWYRGHCMHLHLLHSETLQDGKDDPPDVYSHTLTL